MSDQEIIIIQWLLIIASSLLFIIIAPRAKSLGDFFKGSKLDQAPGFWMLTSSLVISWIFAKSITNSANLGLSYGIVGGVSYAAYYLSFIVAGVVIYYMRTRGGFSSIHGFLKHRYGQGAIIVFSILIGFRLFNEVWSNTIVIGSYFGDQGSMAYYGSILVFTLLTVIYTIKGGLRSSLLTDLIQMLLFGILIIAILCFIMPAPEMSVETILSSGDWSATGGIYLLFVALLQVFSYPFHDPVMTDRAFIAAPKLTLKSFALATLLGSMSIILFSVVGIYGKQIGVEGQAAVEVSRFLGPIMMLMINFIMVTSAASTLDSAFNSFSKLMVIDLNIFGQASIRIGRIAIIIAAVLGTIPIFFSPTILSATTISGTMVIGLTPIFLFYWLDAPKVSFHLSVGIGIAIGIFHLLYPTKHLSFLEGPYDALLSVNLVGLILCIFAYLLPVAIIQINKR